MPLPALRLASGRPLDVAADVLALPLLEGGRLDAAGTTLAADLDGLADAIAAEAAKGEPGEVVSIATLGRIGVRTLLLVGVGDPAKATPATWRKVGATLVRKAGKATTVTTTLAADTDAAGLQAFAEGALLAAYSYTEFKSDPKPSTLREVTLLGSVAATRQKALDRARTRAEATVLTRDLANQPSLDKTPQWLATQAKKLAKRGLDVTVLEPDELAARGFGGILGVGMGSTRSPRLIQVDYTPAEPRKRSPYVVLVGKGITFDSGGLSLKPNEGMAAMKTDMAAGAAVLGVLSALPALRLRVKVTGLVPAAENLPSGTAMRPGDVLHHYGGRTVEVLNTDAEGRLVLADALAYADLELQPDYLIDLATLTGAISVALGKKTAGCFTDDDALATALADASAAAGERLWRMPLVEDYRGQLDSAVADLKNVGGPMQGGSITAALFLREFAGDRRWAHLDIAGAARSDADDDENPKGATGYGVRTLLTWLATL